MKPSLSPCYGRRQARVSLQPLLDFLPPTSAYQRPGPLHSAPGGGRGGHGRRGDTKSETMLPATGSGEPRDGDTPSDTPPPTRSGRAHSAAGGEDGTWKVSVPRPRRRQTTHGEKKLRRRDFTSPTAARGGRKFTPPPSKAALDARPRGSKTPRVSHRHQQMLGAARGRTPRGTGRGTARQSPPPCLAAGLTRTPGPEDPRTPGPEDPRCRARRCRHLHGPGPRGAHPPGASPRCTQCGSPSEPKV